MTAELLLTTRSPQETRDVAAALAPLLRAGDVVGLSGELGAGKTCFVQGAARALGVTGRVTSPTFTLVRRYDESRPPLVHCDVYRLDRLQDVLELGDEVLAPDVVTFVEWGDAVAELLPDDRLDVDLVLADGGAGLDAPAGPGSSDDPGAGAGTRRLRLIAHGSWNGRLDAVADACGAWVEERR